MKNILIYSHFGLNFTKQKPNHIVAAETIAVTYDFKNRIYPNCNVYAITPDNYDNDFPEYILPFDWDFSNIDEIIMHYGSLKLIDGKPEENFIRFLKGISSEYTGKVSSYYTDTSLRNFNYIIEYFNSEQLSKHFFNYEQTQKILNLHDNLHRIYCTFSKFPNELTSNESLKNKLYFVDMFRLNHTLIHKPIQNTEIKNTVLYVGSKKPVRMQKMQQMGLYDSKYISINGRASDSNRSLPYLETLQLYANHFANLIVVDTDMENLGMPHRYLQSLFIGRPFFLENSFRGKFKIFSGELEQFIFINNEDDLKIKIDRLLTDKTYYDKISSLVQVEFQFIIGLTIEQFLQIQY